MFATRAAAAGAGLPISVPGNPSEPSIVSVVVGVRSPPAFAARAPGVRAAGEQDLAGAQQGGGLVLPSHDERPGGRPGTGARVVDLAAGEVVATR